MSITIPKRVRILDGIADPLGGSRENLLGARYEINQIGRASGIENWLPSLDSNLQLFGHPAKASRWPARAERARRFMNGAILS
jgi:hypothetical protein